MQRQSSTAMEEKARAASVSPTRLEPSAQRQQEIERAAGVARARLVSSRRPVTLTTEEVYAMVSHYRINIRAQGRDESLRNELAAIWMERNQPVCVPRLLRDLREGDTQHLAQEWTSDDELEDFLTF
ncbi:uncharacterized protein N7498_000417 [Penicillium cinerascens]|uniref:Uncharacterized protein n=1 Tax=Penicillium cinerascens TaxID=70096 RepID=A0A9W9NGT8_9EURO|nr:uncharacterized protein N7498_000417 [Penicillium cinerascens]KAJ5218318.1 hypothetical protein N7498_000417 [Penicillium cinerascens]